MDNLKNVIAAISLSLAVIVFYTLFFSNPNQESDNLSKEENKTLIENSETPTIEEKIEVKKISRDEAMNSSERIYFENNFVKGSINLKGGEIDDFEFKYYDETLNSKDKIKLLNPMATEEGYALYTGWTTNSDISLPNINSIWKVEGNNNLTPNNPIKITYKNDSGIIFERLISIDEKYLFNIKQTLVNNSSNNYKFYPYAIIKRNNLPNDLTDFYILHEGYSIIDGNDLDEIDYSDVREKKFSKEADNAVLVQGDKYWMTSIIPEKGRPVRFDINYNKKYTASYIDMKGYESRPNTVIENNIQSLIGAKEIELINRYQEDLKIEKLDLIVNFGNLYFVVKPMWFILSYIYKSVGNYGYAIILMTILVRLVFFPLNQYSMKSMGKMRKLGPEIENIKAKYKDDKQQQQKEMMKLYKVNKINPASSCFPILVQIPIFFSIYKLLLLDVDMRHSNFIWIWEDLSAKDPTSFLNLFGLLNFQVPSFLEVGILPILMGGSMWLQMKLSPQPSGNDEMQKVQKKIFAFLPLFLTFILAPFAAGLVLYWCVTNILTIIQQWIINRTINTKI
tara:strand:- start:192 stop:1886 length:1695 start_codon:yes stop_codon:yes gene_type:complete